MTSSDDVQEYVDNVPEGDPLAHDEGLGRSARGVRNQGKRARNMVNEIRQHLVTEPNHGRIRNFVVPPTWHDVFAGAQVANEKDWFVHTVDYFKQIADKYSDGDFEPAEIERDILRLSTQLIYFSSWVNYMDAAATKAESDRKIAEQRAIVEVRNWAEVNGLSIRALGADTARAIAAEHTQDLRDFDDTFQITSASIKGFYFALKDFVEYLDRVSQRAQHERYASRRMDGAGHVS